MSATVTLSPAYTWLRQELCGITAGLSRIPQGFACKHLGRMELMNFIITRPGQLKPFVALQRFLDLCSGSSFYVPDWTPIQAPQSPFLFRIPLITFTQPHFLNVLYCTQFCWLIDQLFDDWWMSPYCSINCIKNLWCTTQKVSWTWPPVISACFCL